MRCTAGITRPKIGTLWTVLEINRTIVGYGQTTETHVSQYPLANCNQVHRETKKLDLFYMSITFTNVVRI